MKILTVHLDNCGIYQGPSEVIANLNKELGKLGQEPRMVYEESLPELYEKVKKWAPKVDAMVCVGYMGSLATELFPKDKPVIWSWDEVPENHWNMDDIPIYTKLHRLSGQKNVFIITGTQDDANVIEKIYKRIDYVIPYGIDFDFFSLGARPEWWASFKVLQVGWLGRGKNQLDTLKALKEFIKHVPDSKLYLVGGKIPLGSGPAYWDRCKEYIEEYNLPANMVGPLPREGVRDYYYNSDVSLNPLNNTGGQLTVMEGICTGLPTIVSTKFVLRDTVKEFSLVNDNYLDALFEVYDNWDWWNKKALMGREWIKENFTWSRWARNILNVLKEKV